MQVLKKKSVIVVALFLLSICPHTACSEITLLIPSIALQEEYNDNIFFDSVNEIDDSITTVSPGINLQQQSERLNASIQGRLSGIFYQDNNQLDSWDQFYSGRFAYQLTPRAGVSATASYTEDSRSDRDIEETGLVLTTDKRRRQRYSLAWSYELTEKTAVDISYGFADDEFEKSGLSDFTSHTINLGLTHDLSNFTLPTQGRIGFGYFHYDYPDDDVDNYNMTIGLLRQFSETMNGSIDVGGRYTEVNDKISNRKKDDWGGVGRISLTSAGEYTSTRVSVSHEVMEASGRRSPTERSSIILSVGRDFTEKIRGNLSAGYYLNRADRDEFENEIDERTYRIRPWISYNVIKDLDLILSYTFTSIKDSVTNTDRERNLVFVRLDYQYPLFD